MIVSYPAVNEHIGSWPHFAHVQSLYRSKSFGMDYPSKTKRGFSLSQVLYHGKVKQLARPVFVSVADRDGYTQIDCKELDIYSAGKSYQEAFESFSEDFSFAVDFYAHGDLSTMTKDAVLLRERLSSILGVGENRK